MYKSTKHEAGVLGFLLKQEPMKTISGSSVSDEPNSVSDGPESDEFGPLNSRTYKPGEVLNMGLEAAARGSSKYIGPVPFCTADEARRRNGITNVLINKPHENCRWDRLDDWQEWHAALNGPTEAQLKIMHDWGLRCEQLKEELYGHVPKQLAQQFDAIERKRRLDEQGRQYRVNLLRTDKSLPKQKAELVMHEAWDKMTSNREAGYAHNALVQGQTVNWAIWKPKPVALGDGGVMDCTSIEHVRFQAHGRRVFAHYDGFELDVGSL